MKEKYYVIGCEYDYGQRNKIFNSKEEAVEWLKQQVKETENYNMVYWDDIVADGLYWIDEVILTRVETKV